MKETTAILLNAKTSREALRTLYHFTKGKKETFTLGSILLKTGIPSRGYLSMVFNGKKTLGEKYLGKIAKVFGLSPAETAYLEVLVRIDLSKAKATIAGLRAELAKARLELEVAQKVVGSRFGSYVLISEIFCALSLFKEPPTLNALLAKFGNHELLQVQGALAELENLGIIAKDPKTGAFRQLQNKVSWVRGDKVDDVVRGIEEIYRDGIEKLPRYFADREISLYNASIVTAKWSDYVRLLPKIREEIYKLENQIESDEADALVRFNIQLYPVTKPSV